MEIDLRRIGSVVVLRFRQPLELQGETAVGLRDRIRGLVADGHRHLVFDASTVTFVDSLGLGSLVSSLRLMRAAEGDLHLAAVPPEVQAVMHSTRLDHVLTSHESVEAAVAAFGDAA